MNIIGKLIASGTITPATGRMLEIGFYSAIATGAGYLADAATGGQLVEWKTVLSIVVTAFLAYVAKAKRDAEPTL